MRNLFLALLLANFLVLAWYQWINPPPERAVVPPQLTVNLNAERTAAPEAGDGASPGPGRVALPVTQAPGGGCLRVGPFATLAAAQQAAATLAARGLDSRPIAVDSEIWLGRWVQVRGFSSLETAEAARERLVAGGVTDAYLMQDGAGHTISLGVFREEERARRVAVLARRLGFEPTTADRFRPGVEDWLLVSAPLDQSPLDQLRLSGAQILRAESTRCDPWEAGSPAPPAR